MRTVKTIFVLGCLFFCLTGCTHAKPGFLTDTNYLDFRPISPTRHEGTKVFVSGSFVDKKWEELTHDEISNLLPNHSALVFIEKINVDGSISYGPAAVTAEVGNYIVYLDYVKYKLEDFLSVDKKSIVGTAQVGVGLRIKANIVTNKENLNLGGLAGIGLAAKNEDLTGQLSVEIIGLDSKEIGLLVPLGVEISPQSIQGAVQAAAAIKAKLYDSGTLLRPHILAVKKADSATPIAAVITGLQLK